MDFFESIQILLDNPLYFTIFGSTITGIILYICKDIPVKILNTVLGFMTVSVEVNQSTDLIAYESLERELHNTKLYYICGNFQLVHEWLLRKLHMNCAQSTIFMGRLTNTWCLITKYTDNQVNFNHVFIYKVRFLTRNKNKVQDFLENLLTTFNSSTDGDNVKVYKYIDGCWSFFFKRKTDYNCILQNTVENLLVKVNKYSGGKVGVLLHGKPGCGKTHLIQMMATMLDRNIYYMNLSEFRNDGEFIKAILSVHNPSIILFEDIDCNNGVNRKELKLKDILQDNQEQDNGVSLSCLLNVFDGLLAQENQMIVATTNHIEKLDAALIRSGRFDIVEEINELSPKDICLFLSNYYRCTIPKNNISCHITVSDLVKYCKVNTLNKVILILESQGDNNDAN